MNVELTFEILTNLSAAKIRHDVEDGDVGNIQSDLESLYVAAVTHLFTEIVECNDEGDFEVIARQISALVDREKKKIEAKDVVKKAMETANG